MALLQIALGVFELGVTALAMHVLIPAEMSGGTLALFGAVETWRGSTAKT
jgi:hypothetical protein